MAQVRSARAVNWRGNSRLVNCLLYLYCVSDEFGNDFYASGTASNFLRISEAKRVHLKSMLSDFLVASKF